MHVSRRSILAQYTRLIHWSVISTHIATVDPHWTTHAAAYDAHRPANAMLLQCTCELYLRTADSTSVDLPLDAAYPPALMTNHHRITLVHPHHVPSVTFLLLLSTQLTPY